MFRFTESVRPQTLLTAAFAAALAAPASAQLVDSTSSILVPPLPPSYYAGAAWGDVDGDGHPDLYVTNYFGPNHLFLNVPGPLGGPARILVDMTPPVLMDPMGHGEGAVFADFDNDGDQDLYLVNAGGTPNHLFANLGSGMWADVTGPSGTGHPGIGEGCAVADWDKDGDLDLFVMNYGATPAGEADVWYRNEGGLVFTDATHTVMPHGISPGGACAFADYDLDGDPDLFVGNDGAPNHLFENLGGTFVDATPMAGGSALADAAGGCFGVRWIDFDNDGDLDLYVSNSASFLGTSATNHMFRNNVIPLGSKTFTLVTNGAEDTGSGMSVTGGDLDRDGHEDLAMANFGVSKVYLKGPSSLLRFVTAPSAWFTDPFPTDSSSSATRCDFDRDGDLDVFLGGSVVQVFLNHGGGAGAVTPSPYTLSVRFLGDRSAPFLVPRDGHGTRARLVLGGPFAPSRAMQQVDGGSGYSQDAPECFWSIPTARSGGPAVLDSLDITWADGRFEELMAMPAPTVAAPNQRLQVHYPAGIETYGTVAPTGVRLVRSSTGIEFTPAQAGAPEFALATPELADGSLGLLVIGFARASTATPVGTLLVDPVVVQSALGSGGAARWPLPIPADPSWVGATLHMQSFVMEPAGTVRISQGLSATIQP